MLSLHAGFGCGKGPVSRPIGPGRAPGSVGHPSELSLVL
jgi:hypothetical protein